jgi:uncharacterized membrane protein
MQVVSISEGRIVARDGKASVDADGGPDEHGSGDSSPQPVDIKLLQQLGLDVESPHAIAEAIELLSTVTMSRSPYPSAEMLSGYEQFRSGFADRILDKIDAQTTHRQRLEEARVFKDERRRDHSQIFGFVTAIAGLSVSALITLQGGSFLVASIIAIVAVGGPSAANVLARYFERHNG